MTNDEIDEKRMEAFQNDMLFGKRANPIATKTFLSGVPLQMCSFIMYVSREGINVMRSPHDVEIDKKLSELLPTYDTPYNDVAIFATKKSSEMQELAANKGNMVVQDYLKTHEIGLLVQRLLKDLFPEGEKLPIAIYVVDIISEDDGSSTFDMHLETPSDKFLEISYFNNMVQICGDEIFKTLMMVDKTE